MKNQKEKNISEYDSFDSYDQEGLFNDFYEYNYYDYEKAEKNFWCDENFDDTSLYKKFSAECINFIEEPWDEPWNDIIQKDILYENSVKKEHYLSDITENFEDKYPQHLSQRNIFSSKNLMGNVPFQQLRIAENIRYRDKIWFYYSPDTDSFQKVTQQEIERLIFNDLPWQTRSKLNRRRMDDLLYIFMRDDMFLIPQKSYPDYVKCTNGTYVISDRFFDQSNRPHGEPIAFDYCVNANYAINVSIDDAPTFKRFLDTSLNGDPVKIKSVLQSIGYLLSDRCDAKKAFIFYGKPNTGKSVLLKLIEFMIGSENVSNISMNKLHDRFLTAELAENRININAEISECPLTTIDTFKLIVGADMLTAEKKGQDPFKFKCQCKLLFAGNVLPKLKNTGYTDAFFDRLHIINFNTSITEKDRRLESKLQNEVDVIFSLAMDELSELVLSNYNFAVPEDSTSLLNEYRKDIDSIEAFITECCIFDEKAITAKDEVYHEYCTYCKESGIEAISDKTFAKELLKKNPSVAEKKSRCGGKYENPKACYTGVHLNLNKEEDATDDIR